jgi:hypothetical protein
MRRRPALNAIAITFNGRRQLNTDHCAACGQLVRFRLPLTLTAGSPRPATNKCQWRVAHRDLAQSAHPRVPMNRCPTSYCHIALRHWRSEPRV